MKKHLIYLFIFLAAFQVNAQETVTETTLTKKQSKEIKKLFKNYFKELHKASKDYDKIMDFTYPKLFTITSKSDKVTQIKKQFNNSEMTIKFDKMELNEIKKSIRFNEVTYTKVVYKSETTFHFIKKEKETEANFDSYVYEMFKILKKQFKSAKITRDGENIYLKGTKEILAIQNKEFKKDWYLLDLLKNSKDYYAKFLPDEIATYISSSKF